MNYLAHFHLAHLAAATGTRAGDDGLLIGALLGDFVKGPLKGEYPASWERGIRVHRRIDAFTDTHPEVAQLLAAMPGEYRRYGGIMLDVCFDHCLSRHWSQFHPQQLEGFSQQVYRMLAPHHAALPDAARRQAERLAHYDVLAGMQHWQTVENMLAGIGRRLRRDNPLADCGPLLQERFADIERGFLRLYPDLIADLEREFGGPV